jgi:hypothetical protein
MTAKLTRKQKKFVEAMVDTGNGTQSALVAYDTESPTTAAVIASENLTKPNIVEALAERLSEELVIESHESLLTAVKLDYFVFPKLMSDEEIKEHVEAQGLTVINVRPSEKGKLAFFSLPDGQSRGKGIELYHKIMGTFAPDKHAHLHIHKEPSEKVKELARKLNK